MEAETITGEMANAVVQRMLEESPLTEKQAEQIFRSKFKQTDGPESVSPEIKRYRSTSHRPDAACVANSRQEAREFFRKLMGVEKLPSNFTLVRY